MAWDHTLGDALGHRLAGKVIAFQLGSQQAQATTDANGVASTSLKLAQKNGKYPLIRSAGAAQARAQDRPECDFRGLAAICLA